MMNHYLSIVLRNQFNLFYRFGYTFIPKTSLLVFDDVITDDITSNIIELLSTCTPFEYDEEYLILQFEKLINEKDIFVKFDIQDLVKIYPLSNQAKASIESKIDHRIRLEKPIFEKILPKIESEIEKKEVEKAISALWTICKLDRPVEKYLSDIGIENIFKGIEHRKKGTKAHKIQDGSYWEYLIAYDRFDYYPNSTLGYFYDSGQVLAFSKQLQTFEGSKLHKTLEYINASNPSIKLPEIINFLETEQGLKGYISQTTYNDTKYYIIAPLFLMLRHEIRNSDDVSQTKLFKNLEYLKKIGDSFYYSVILLGAFFGFRKFYDLYYESLNLRFYKSFTEIILETKLEDNQESRIQNTDGNKLSTIPVEGEIISENKLGDNLNEDINKQIVQSHIKVESKGQAIPSAEDSISNAGSQTYNYITESQNVEIKNQEEPKETESIESSIEVESDKFAQFRIIIEEAFTKQSEINIRDLVTLIKNRTGEKVSNTVVKNVIKYIDGIIIIPVKNKKPEVARKRETMGKLFND